MPVLVKTATAWLGQTPLHIYNTKDRQTKKVQTNAPIKPHVLTLSVITVKRAIDTN